MENATNELNLKDSYVEYSLQLLSEALVVRKPQKSIDHKQLLEEIYLEVTNSIQSEFGYLHSVVKKEPNQYCATIVTKRLRRRICEMKALLSIRLFFLRNNANSCLANLSLLYGLCTGRITSLLRAYFTTSLSRAVA